MSGAIDELVSARRAIPLVIAGTPRVIAVEDAGRYRDALGTPLPPGLPNALLEPVVDPIGDLVQRYARTHGPFTNGDCAARFGLGVAVVDLALARLSATGRLVQGEFRPGGREREWCGTEVLRTLRQRSLARLRKQVEPVDRAALGRFTLTWQGIARRRRGGLDTILDAVEALQGTPLPASELEREILPARIDGYAPADLDRLISAGEVVWAGVEPLGERDGRVTVFLTDHLHLLRPPGSPPALDNDLEARIVEHLREAGASFFPAIHAAVGGGFPQEVIDGLWSLVWRGLVTNDALHALRAYVEAPD